MHNFQHKILLNLKLNKYSFNFDNKSLTKLKFLIQLMNKFYHWYNIEKYYKAFEWFFSLARDFLGCTLFKILSILLILVKLKFEWFLWVELLFNLAI